MAKVEYDQNADAMYIWLRKAKYEISEEIAENVIIDLSKDGRIIGIEILDVSKNLSEKLVNKIIRSEKIAVTA